MDPRDRRLQREGWRYDVERQVRELDGQDAEVPAGLCGWMRDDGTPCERRAGWNTDHLGAGRCSHHKGKTRQGLFKGAWLMAHGLARKLNVTPWEALLEEVRRTAGAVAWLQLKVGETEDDEQLLIDSQAEDELGMPAGLQPMRPWYRMYVAERQWLGRVSKMALDAGVAERMVAQMELEGQEIARVISATLDALELTPMQWDIARATVRRELMALDARGQGTPLGDVVEGEEVVMEKLKEQGEQRT